MENIFFIFILSHEDVFVIDLRETEGKGKIEISITCLLHMAQAGTEPTT